MISKVSPSGNGFYIIKIEPLPSMGAVGSSKSSLSTNFVVKIEIFARFGRPPHLFRKGHFRNFKGIRIRKDGIVLSPIGLLRVLAFCLYIPFNYWTT